MNTVTRRIILIAILMVFLNACGKTDKEPSQGAMTEPSSDADVIMDTTLGLSKTSVFETPEPEVASYSPKSPGSSELYPRAYPDAPPQIPHDVDNFKPITAKNNTCVGCHHNPAMRGKEVARGIPTPMPESHYTDLRHKPDTVVEQIIGARYICTQCHVPQANVNKLVENTFSN